MAFETEPLLIRPCQLDRDAGGSLVLHLENGAAVNVDTIEVDGLASGEFGVALCEFIRLVAKSTPAPTPRPTPTPAPNPWSCATCTNTSPTCTNHCTNNNLFWCTTYCVGNNNWACTSHCFGNNNHSCLTYCVGQNNWRCESNCRDMGPFSATMPAASPPYDVQRESSSPGFLATKRTSYPTDTIIEDSIAERIMNARSRADFEHTLHRLKVSRVRTNIGIFPGFRRGEGHVDGSARQ